MFYLYIYFLIIIIIIIKVQHSEILELFQLLLSYLLKNAFNISLMVVFEALIWDFKIKVTSLFLEEMCSLKKFYNIKLHRFTFKPFY